MADCLALHDVCAGYGETVVLEHVSLGVAEGGTLAVLGRNGVGKTTLLATVLGHTTLHAGGIAFRGQPIERLRPFQRARLGIGYVPQEREIFPSLNVDENLGVAARNGAEHCPGPGFHKCPPAINVSARAAPTGRGRPAGPHERSHWH